MLSYDHAFHAGNHADLIKHLCLIGAIERLRQKNKPFTVFDTHAGRGMYQLDSEQALKNQEFATGIATLNQGEVTHPLLTAYKTLTQDDIAQSRYPGSPVIAARLLRDNDQLHSMELHPSAITDLQTALRPWHEQAHAHKRDGLEGVLAMTPPVPNRGLVLIDPSYEQLKEYELVEKTVAKLLKRWSNAQVMVWYPLLTERAGAKSGRSEMMCEQLSSLGHETVCIELLQQINAPEAGMYGSGMCLLNPAYQIDQQVSEALNEIKPRVGEHAAVNIRWLYQN